MKKNSNQYICSNCSAVYSRWQGECSQCHEWNTIVDNTILQTSTTKVNKKSVEVSKLSDILHKSEPVIKIGMPGLETVLGGGIHQSQIVLIAGEPGIGKSTLLLQILHNYPGNSVYITGEESLSQIAKRAERVAQGKFERSDFVSSTDLDTTLSLISAKKHSLVIIDSIQTIVDSDSGGFAGSVNQVRLCTFKITEIAKKYNVSVIIVGQITKEGDIAGPKMMEHLVDTVLYFEGDRKSDLRILKSYKNRFGSVGETAIFEMKQNGLIEIVDPGRYFISKDNTKSEGVAYSIVSDGSIIYAVEVQALVNKSFFPIPKRLATNYDNNRLQMLLAVLQKKLKLGLYESDVYVNVVGGVKLNDTSADLAVCAAIISSFKNKKYEDSVFIGEVGLTGDIQRTARYDAKLKQAERLGFKHIYSNQNVRTLSELIK
jgi:DNA repair protein RadA/Sms